MQPWYFLHNPALQTNVALVTSQPLQGITAVGYILLRTKSTHLSSNLEPPGRNTPDGTQTDRVPYKPVTEKPALGPYSKEFTRLKISSLLSSFFKSYILSLFPFEIFLFSLFIFSLSNSFQWPSSVCGFSHKLSPGQISFKGSFAQVRTWEETLRSLIFRSSPCHCPSDHKVGNQRGTELQLQSRFFKIIIKVPYSSSEFRWTLRNGIQMLLRAWVLFWFFSICWAVQSWFCLWGNPQFISLLQEQLRD